MCAELFRLILVFASWGIWTLGREQGFRGARIGSRWWAWWISQQTTELLRKTL